jgi:hypothetical protein
MVKRFRGALLEYQARHSRVLFAGIQRLDRHELHISSLDARLKRSGMTD